MPLVSDQHTTPILPVPTNQGTLPVSSSASYRKESERTSVAVRQGLGSKQAGISQQSHKRAKIKTVSPVHRHSINYSNLNQSKDEAERKRKRAERFNQSPKSSLTNSNSHEVQDDFKNLNALSSKSQMYDKSWKIVGRCTKLEKSYLRLTSEPNPDLIRPLGVLKVAFNELLNKINNKSCTYTYLSDQLKAIRQDLRVQMLENRFTVKVYQTHARLAIENSDLGEFNQCQSRLMVLFDNPDLRVNMNEFTGYLIIYHLMTSDFDSVTRLRLRLLKDNRSIYESTDVQNALNLADAKLLTNYFNFFKIYLKLSGLHRQLVNLFISRERLNALTIICKSYNQINLHFLSECLGFDSLKNLEDYLTHNGLDNFIESKEKTECEGETKIFNSKSGRPKITQLFNKMGKIDIKGQK